MKKPNVFENIAHNLQEIINIKDERIAELEDRLKKAKVFLKAMEGRVPWEGERKALKELLEDK